MIIQHNLPAINAHRQMGINNSSISKSLEKLSSGFAINRAADNAAGLAISEKMRGQISGLGQASKNSQDGISLIQTAEGALNETHSILQRMRELSVQSANGTYQDAVDRENITKEVDALKSEIDRISTSTHFNNKQLLDGSISGIANDGTTNKIDGATIDKLGLTKGDVSKLTTTGTKNEATVITLGVVGNTTVNVVANARKNTTINTSSAAGVASSNFTAATGSATFTFDGKVTASEGTLAVANAAMNTAAGAEAYKAAMDGKTVSVDNLNITFNKDLNASDGVYDEATQTLSVGIKDLVACGTATHMGELEDALKQAFDKLPATSGYQATVTADGSGKITLKSLGVNPEVMEGGYSSSTAANSVITFGATAGNVKSGAVFTVDGKNYEFTDDASKVAKGNIAVTVATGGIADATGSTLSRALFNAIQGQADYTKANGNESSLVITQAGDPVGGALDSGVITITNKGKDADVEKVDTAAKRDEITNTFKIDQKVERGTKIKIGDYTHTFDSDETADAAITKLIAGYNAASAAAGGANDGAAAVAGDVKSMTVKPINGARQDITITPPTSAKSVEINLDPDKLQIGESITFGDKNYEFVSRIGDKVKEGSIAIVKNSAVAENLYKAILGNSLTDSDAAKASQNGNKITIKGDYEVGTKSVVDPVRAAANEKLTFQIGANGRADQRVSLQVDNMGSAFIGKTTKNNETGEVKVEASIADIDVGTRAAANDAIDVIDQAINQVSGTRADLGALQNRLEHTINSLGVASENLTAAESRIRDVDMAKEMMAFSKNQILAQASQAMLAQANALPQGVLQLLQ